jgi:hypothetical protein
MESERADRQCLIQDSCCDRWHGLYKSADGGGCLSRRRRAFRNGAQFRLQLRRADRRPAAIDEREKLLRIFGCGGAQPPIPTEVYVVAA